MILTATSGSSPSLFLANLQKFPRKSAVASSSPLHPQSVPLSPPGIDPSPLPALQLVGPIASFSDIPLCYHCLHAQDAVMVELPKDVICHGDFNDINNSDDHNMKELQILSRDTFQHTAEIVDRLGIDSSDDPLHEEVVKGGSEPSTPKYSSNPLAIKDNMRRSLSIDSAPCIDNVEESPEYKMSEEAFKKRIEDYIFKVNAKLRSETRLT